MLAIALTALALSGLTVYLSFRLIRAERREFARRESVLVDQVCHLAGRTWTPPPRETFAPLPDPSPDYDLAEF